MRQIIILLIIHLPTLTLGTGQGSELIIYCGDTLEMLSEPLEFYLREHEPREKINPWLEHGCSTGLWRGYVGLWEIENDKLYLIDVFLCGDESKSIKNQIFPNSDDKILAKWFSDTLYIERGKVIKYNHSGYDRHYEKEILVATKHGKVVSKIEYNNGVQTNDKGISRDPEHIHTSIYKLINWDSLPKLSREYILSATFKIDDDGEVDILDIEGTLSSIYRNQLISAMTNLPPIQVFYSRGVPLNEGWVMKFEFSRKNKRKYAHL